MRAADGTAHVEIANELGVAAIPMVLLWRRRCTEEGLAITPQTAIQLERAVGISATFWNGLESRYRETLARARAAEELEQHTSWPDKFPLADMVRFRLLPQGAGKTEMVGHLLALFGVSNPIGWDQQWGRATATFRSSRAYQSSPYALAAWLRWGEMKVQKVDLAEYDEGKFRAALVDARRLSRLASLDLAISRLQRSLAAAGVAFVVLPELSGTRVSGAARWLRPNHAFIQLSLRYLTDDQFWFSFFHEAEHVLAKGRRADYIENIDPRAPRAASEVEESANAFARDQLISPVDYQRFREVGQPSTETVRRFASEVGISPGIVVGRLQHDGVLARSRMNHLKRRYELSL